MKYDEALRLWGKKKLQESNHLEDIDEVEVKFFFYEGFSCCSGCVTDFHDNYEYEPSKAYVTVIGHMKDHANDDDDEVYYHDIIPEEFSLIETLRELVEIGGGRIE